uniref:Small ribosomal subunit protein uS9c n=1 Tax=Volvox africanus TaxID=51714 RepID=A0A385KQ34_9CHLO|nr:ribosomal protein S9 [Volvox africanus]AXZ97344.1 ribosomal protein S9 [Volvox africanus]
MVFIAKAVGRRKEAVAQVQIKQGTGLFIINNKSVQEYLQNDFYSLLSVKAPFDVLSTSKQTDILSTSSTFTESTDLSLTPVEDCNNMLQSLKFDTIVKVKGGGLMGQTEAIRLGISRAICLLSTNTNEPLPISNTLDIRKQLKDKGYLTQDSRVKERRKYGLKKARKASQYHKR